MIESLQGPLAPEEKLQSPEGDWADCDSRIIRGLWSVLDYVPLQSPEGDWADCDLDEDVLVLATSYSGLQSPEGD